MIEEVTEGIEAAPAIISSCKICEANSPKYTCPKCGVKTCSLACVKSHKSGANCSGTAERTKYVKMSQMDNLTLLSDYRFLEEASHLRETAVRTAEILQMQPREIFHGNQRGGRGRGSHRGNRGRRFQKQEMDPDFGRRSRLQQNCRQRGIHVLLQPFGLERRTKNLSHFEPVSESIFWTLDLCFVGKDRKLALTLNKIPEYLSLGTLTRQFFNRKSADRLLTQENSRTAEEVSDIVDQLKDFQLEFENLLILQNVVHKPALKDPKFYVMDKDIPLKDGLRGKMINEYPKIFVCLPSQAHNFPIVSDEEIARMKEDAEAKRKAFYENKSKQNRSRQHENKSIAKSEEDPRESGEMMDQESKPRENPTQEPGPENQEKNPNEANPENQAKSLNEANPENKAMSRNEDGSATTVGEPSNDAPSRGNFRGGRRGKRQRFRNDRRNKRSETTPVSDVTELPGLKSFATGPAANLEPGYGSFRGGPSSRGRGGRGNRFATGRVNARNERNKVLDEIKLKLDASLEEKKKQKEEEERKRKLIEKPEAEKNQNQEKTKLKNEPEVDCTKTEKKPEDSTVLPPQKKKKEETKDYFGLSLLGSEYADLSFSSEDDETT